MARKAVIDAVKARQASGWTTHTVFYPNDAVKVPADLSPYVQVEFPIGMGARSALAHSYRDTGTIRFIIHVPLKTGLDTAATYADELAGLFRSARFANVETYEPTPPTPLGDDGAYYRVSFSTPYTFDFSA